eukprot:50348_1
MPKRLRYTQVLGLNARGLTRHQKKHIVWKQHVKGKLARSQYAKSVPQNKRASTVNTYWDKYHDEKQRFETMNLKEFLQNPSRILQIPPKRKKIIFNKLKKAQFRIEYLKYKYSVAIPDKKALKLISVVAKGQGVIEMKTSNHSKGYWSHLLSQRDVSCKVFNVQSSDNSNSNNAWKHKKKNKHKNNKKSKQTLAAEAKEWITILNKDSSSKINDILKDYSQYVLLMIYPDFEMDRNVINDILERQNKTMEDMNEEDEGEMNNNERYQAFGSLMKSAQGTLPSVECLRSYKGNYVVHVGELFGCTYDASNVWGRTTSMQFQIELQTHFHKVYQYEMARWPMFRDTLTIWRRNKVSKVGQEQIVCLQETETNDTFITKYWQDLFGQRVSSNKKGKNIFEGANYAASK